MVSRLVKRAAKAVLERLGYAVIPLHWDTRRTLCGLTALPIRTVFDIGANRGQSAKHFCRLFPEATILSFEPLPEAFQVLSAVAASSNGRIRAYNLALSNAVGETSMHYHVGHETSSSLLPLAEARALIPGFEHCESIKIQTTTLDDAVSRFNLSLENDVLLKLDVQGAELQVLAGGPQLLGRVRAIITEVSLAYFYNGQPTLIDLTNKLQANGFAFGGCVDQHAGLNGIIHTIDALFIREKMPS